MTKEKVKTVSLPLAVVSLIEKASQMTGTHDLSHNGDRYIVRSSQGVVYVQKDTNWNSAYLLKGQKDRLNTVIEREVVNYRSVKSLHDACEAEIEQCTAIDANKKAMGLPPAHEKHLPQIKLKLSELKAKLDDSAKAIDNANAEIKDIDDQLSQLKTENWQFDINKLNSLQVELCL